MSFVSSVEQPDGEWDKAYWFCFQDNNLMLEKTDDQVLVPLLRQLDEKGIKPVRIQFIGMKEGIPCFSAELPLNLIWPENCEFLNLKELFHQLDECTYKAAVYAHQIVVWDKNHQYCGVCGSETGNLPGERAKKCPQCGHVVFPRIAPAIMVAIIKDNKLLLAKNRMFRQGFYSVLAGFVDPAEQLEECVAREVKEEVGLTIKNLRYFGSQPWPFPNSLMIAFTADHEDGEIAVDNREIIEADWYSADKLPKCPTGNLSVAGRLIDWFKENYS